MPSVVSFTAYQNYEQVLPTDLQGDNDAARYLVAEALAGFLGVFDALPATGLTSGAFAAYGSGFTPLTVTPGSGLAVVVGGTGQWAFVQGRMCDTIPQQTLTVPSNTSGNTRTDLISIQYSQINNLATASTRNFEPSPGVFTTGTVYQTSESVNFNYTQNTTTPPSGYVALATVAVPNNASQIVAANITMLLPTFAQLLASLVGAGVSSVNGQTGLVTLSAGTAIAITVPQSGIIQIANTGVASLNGVTGAASITAGAGISVAPSGQNVKITNVGVVSMTDLVPRTVSGALTVEGDPSSDITIGVKPSTSTVYVGRAGLQVGSSAWGAGFSGQIGDVVSIQLPAGFTWLFKITWMANGMNVTGMSVVAGTTLTFGGTAIGAGSGTVSTAGLVNGTANGGQTVGIKWNGSGGGSAIAWDCTIIAIKAGTSGGAPPNTGPISASHGGNSSPQPTMTGPGP